MQNRIFDLLLKEDEITWQTIIYDLVKSEQMDPWDIDISLLAQRYLEAVKKLKEMNFIISGKVILASAILLKIKSQKLVDEDLVRFEELINPPEDDFHDELFDNDLDLRDFDGKRVVIIPKTPQPRKRKVSVEDLVSALQKALAVGNRRAVRLLGERVNEVKVPEKKVDITKVIMDVYERINSFFKSGKRLTFDEFVNSTRREDRIAMFVPLLHLDNQRKIDMAQKEHFGEIEIWLKKE